LLPKTKAYVTLANQLADVALTHDSLGQFFSCGLQRNVLLLISSQSKQVSLEKKSKSVDLNASKVRLSVRISMLETKLQPSPACLLE
jgi:hypothetical protein